MEIKTDQLTQLLREQLDKYDGSVDISEVGEVLNIGDGVANEDGTGDVLLSETAVSLGGNGEDRQLDRYIEQTVTFVGKEEIKIGDKIYKTLRFNFKSSDETLPESKKLKRNVL